MIDILVKLAGIAGFVLSLILAGIEFRRQIVRLEVERPEFYPMGGKLPGNHAFMRMIVMNRSSAAISISTFRLFFPECANDSITAALGEHIILSCTKKSGHTVVGHKDFKNTCLPINLNPYESREIVLYFDHLSPSLQEFLLRLVECSHPESGSTPPSVQIRFHMVTTRHPIEVVVRASVCDFETVGEELSDSTPGYE